ncbi:MAG: aminotransferase class IV [Phycisphaerales bacterium]|nr:aminotransferase class IV [Phycisphaerales bacterium]
MKIWLNGSMMDAADARISVLDAGTQHGVGLFETMRASRGEILQMRPHMERLRNSALELQLTESLNVEALCEALMQLLTANELEDARLRLTLTGGDLPGLQAYNNAPRHPNIFIVSQPPTRYPDEFFDKGIIACIADGRLNPLDPHAGHKTLNYWSRIRALQQAGTSGAGEALWFSVSNHLCSGSVSNIFVVSNGSLLTPIAHGEEEGGALPSPVLPGTVRQFVIDQADIAGIGTNRKMLDIDDMLDADEVFLTNSSWGILPLVGVEKEPISDGLVGTVTKQLRDRWVAFLDSGGALENAD